MKDAVLIAIHPQYCELIASGKKTVELRKTRPKLETPFKCYIYCTKPKSGYDWGLCKDEDMIGLVAKCNYEAALRMNMEILSGKVIGEFVCDRIEDYSEWKYDHAALLRHIDLYAATNGDYKFLSEYIPEKKGFGWHISDLVIYEEPKELSEFVTEGDCDCMNCAKCAWLDKGDSMAEIEDDCNLAYIAVYRDVSLKPIFRPPQSWCYVSNLNP